MKRETVILCIGSNQVAGDSLGPMVGDHLKGLGVKAYVYGSMNRPVNAKNLLAYLDMIDANHSDATLIVVDATVGDKADVGSIRVNRNGVKPGGAMSRNLPRIGDIGILGVVARRSDSLVSTLMQVEMSLVERLSSKISRLLADSLC